MAAHFDNDDYLWLLAESYDTRELSVGGMSRREMSSS